MSRLINMGVGDTAPVLIEQLIRSDDSTPDLTGSTVTFTVATNAGVALVDDAAATIVVGSVAIGGVTVTYAATDGVVMYAWADGDTDTAGGHHRRWKVVYPGGEIEHFPNDRVGYPTNFNDGA